MFNPIRASSKVLHLTKQFTSTTSKFNSTTIRSVSTKTTIFNKSNKNLISLSTVGILGTVGLVSSLVLSDSKPEWEVTVIPTLSADAILPPNPSNGIYKDPQTSTPFPSTLKSDNSTLVLIGTGVRVVSFLSVKVYCAAIYIDEKIYNNLSQIEGWKGFTTDKLLPPFPKPEGVLGGEELIGKLLDTRNDFAVVITPLRSTSLPHLRDGFARAIVARLKQPHVAAGFSPEEGEGHAASISELKGFFPNRPLAKGAPLYVHLNGKDGSARFAVDNANNPSGVENLGTLHNPPLARQLFLSYFGDSGAISEELRKSAAAGFAVILAQALDFNSAHSSVQEVGPASRFETRLCTSLELKVLFIVHTTAL